MIKADLLKERRLELAYKNHRWFDLIRFGEAVIAMGLNGNVIEEGRLQYAIPDREISASQGHLEQNDYYQ